MTPLHHALRRARTLVLAGALLLALAGCQQKEASGEYGQHADNQSGVAAPAANQATPPGGGQETQAAGTGSQPASGTTVQTGSAMAVENAWARPAKPMPDMGSSSAAYFVLRNTGSEDDALVSVSTDVAGKAELHETVPAQQTGQHDHNASDAMTMRPVDKVAVPAGGTVEFRPGGLHVMLMDLKRELAVGDRFQLTLTFEKGGAQIVEVEVREP